MKARYALWMLLVGTGLVFLGGFFRIQHWPGTSFLFVVGLPMETLGTIVLVVKALRYPALKNFLDS